MEIEDKYLSSTNCKDGDIIEFLDAGIKETVDNKFKPGQKKDIYNFQVRVNGKEYIYSPNATTLKNLIKAYGKTTEKWVGKKIQVQLALTTSGAKAIMPTIIDQKA